MISWLFEIATLKLSTKNVTWSEVDYSGIVIPDSFSGITMRWNIAGNGLIAPNEMIFDVSNPGGTYLTTDFEDKFCTVRLIDGDTNVRTWKFKINRAISYYGKITCYCVDFLQEFLVGDYPNTKAPKEIWPSSDAEDSDAYCVPVTLGTAYIPVRSVNTATDRFYVLGESGPTYSVYEVASPRAWPNSSTWSSTSYTMTGSTNSGYQLLQPIIADSDGDDIADAPGLWRSGDTFYDMLCRFERSDTVSLNNPAEWTEYVLEDFGVASVDIDDVSFAAAGANYDALTLGFDGGGWWRKESRERILSNLLAQTDSFLVQTDKVELYQFDKTPKETITDTLRLSFSPSLVTKSINDAGRVHWQESASKPSDVLNGRAVVPTHGGVGATENTPSSEILECRFLSDSISAQKAGILYFQKKFEQSQRINFSVTFSSLTNKATLTPGYVVTVDNTLYGGSNNVVITDMVINPDMRVDFTGVVLKYLEDWGDLTTTTKDVVTDSSSGFQLATTDYNGDLDVDAGADWKTNLLNIPDRFKDTASLGINVTDSYMGYYDGSAFKVFIQNNGNVQFGDPTTGQGFTWNQETGVCTINGSLKIVNPSTVRSDLNVAYGADNTTTSINGGIITTGVIRNSASTMVIDFNNSKITVKGDSNLVVDGQAIRLEYNGYLLGFVGASNVGTIMTSTGWLTLYGDSYVYLESVRSSGTGVTIRTGGADIIFDPKGGSVRPRIDNSTPLGDPSLRWREVWAVDGTINTSDAKEKSNIQDSDFGLDFINELRPKKWIWNGRKRPHYGLLAQDVESVIQKKGKDFAGLIKSNLTMVARTPEEESKSKEKVVVRTEHVKPNDEIMESFDSYGLRYHEFIGPIIKAIQEIDQKLIRIETKQGETK
ncbi:MAG: tail fiber domain-containing protein [Pseudomonas sp.]|nr:tail fiber domain-containing protein [Pseudomonas sp.]